MPRSGRACARCSAIARRRLCAAAARRRSAAVRRATSACSATTFRTGTTRPSCARGCSSKRSVRAVAERLASTASGFAEGLLSRRVVADGADAAATRSTTAIVRVHDANVELVGERVDVLAGYARVVVGRLDEIQPTDVVNPLDVSRFFFEGRSEARLPVLLVRGRCAPVRRASPSRASTCRTSAAAASTARRADVAVQPSRRWRSDPVACLAIGCPTRPFRCRSRAGVHARRTRRAARAYRDQRAGRLERVGVSRLRGVRAVSRSRARRRRRRPPALLLEYPRFTMIGADFETVRGKWGMRGEAAAIRRRQLSVAGAAGRDRPLVRCRRRRRSARRRLHDQRHGAGPFRVVRCAAVRRRSRSDGRTDVSFVVSADRTFARERYRFGRSVSTTPPKARLRPRASGSPTFATTWRSRRRSAGSRATAGPDRPVRRQRLRLRTPEVLFLTL